MKIIVADDQMAVRSALRLLLETEPELRVIGEATSGDELQQVVEELRPDLLILDWELRGLSPARSLDSIHQACPNTRILALSGRPESRRVSLEAGADMFVSKGNPPEDLLSAIRSFHQLAPIYHCP